MKVTLADAAGKKKKVLLGFSVGYFFFGPLYLLFKNVILRGLIFLLIYVLLLWQGSGQYIADIFAYYDLPTEHIDLFVTYTTQYGLYFLIGAAVLHLLLTIYVPRIIVRKLFNKGYMPFSELDTQKLIKHNLVKVGTQSYLTTFGPVNGVGGQIKVKNEKELKYHLEQLTNLLKSGIITKDEYNARRASIIMEK